MNQSAAAPLFTNDAVVFGILMTVLAIVFYTASLPGKGWKLFYTYIPPLLLCYFIPSLLNSMGVFSGKISAVDETVRDYLLPASLVLFTVSLDMKTIMRLGSKAVIVFMAGAVGIVIGGPIALYLVSLLIPEVKAGTGENELWRGLATVAGSWVGGGANQAAMKTVFGCGDELFSTMVVIDVVFSNLVMATSLYLSERTKKIDHFLKADSSAIEAVRVRIETYRASIMRIPELKDMVVLMAVAFGGVAIAHGAADVIVPFMEKNKDVLEAFHLESLSSGFMWVVLISSTIGLLFSFTRARELEGIGASRTASLFLYVLIATIGMQMDIFSIFKNPAFFLIGFIWICIHLLVLWGVAKLIRAPFFFIAVGSQANVGGVASSAVVASAFHPALAPVGVLLAVLGYGIGTYSGWLCALLMQWVYNQ